MSIEQSSLEVTDYDNSGLLPEVIESAMEDVSSVDISVIEGDEHSYLLRIDYEDVADIQDLVCAISMLCMSKGVYHFTVHYMGREGGVVR